MNDLKIKLADLKNGLEIEREVKAFICKELEKEKCPNRLEIEFKASLVSGEVLVTGTVKGELELECSSCNENVSYPIDLKIEQSFPGNVEEIDLEEEIRQLITVNLPVKVLCKESCKGLCPQCGKNLNTGKCECPAVPPLDNRWERLKDLLKK